MSEKIRDVNMKLTALEDVQIREKAPELKPDNKKGIVYKGFTVDIVEEWQGDNYPNTDNNKWYKDQNGDFLWSGGFSEEKKEIIEPITKDKLATDNCVKNKLIDYSAEIENVIEYDFQTYKGDGVTVVVLDTGIDEKHQDLRHLFKGLDYHSRNFVQSEHDYFDLKGHGTHICGLIGAKAEYDFGIQGIAPKCKVWNIKVADKNGNTSLTALKLALQLLVDTEKQIDIVNMSLNTHPSLLNELEKYFAKLDKKGILMVGSANFDDDQLTTYALTPAASKFVISVGAYSEEFKLAGNKSLHNTIDFILPNHEYCSTTIEQEGFYTKLSGSSMNSAIISGILAKIISKIGRAGKEKICKELGAMSLSSNEPIKFSRFNLIKNEKSLFNTKYNS